MSFVYKTLKELEEMTEYQVEKYNDQKRDHELAENRKAAEKAASDKLAEELKLRDEAEKERIKADKEAQEKAIQELRDEHKNELEKLEAKLKGMNFANRHERLKTLSDYITEKLSTDEGEAFLKAFIAGQKLEMEADRFKAIAKPTTGGGYVAPDLIGIEGDGHDLVHARDVMPVYPTISDVVKFLQMTKDSATSPTIVAEGATKPTINYTPTPVSVTVKKIAGLLEINDEVMEDIVGFRAWLAAELPQIYLDSEDAYVFKHSTDGVYTKAEQWVPNGTVVIASNVPDKLISMSTQVRLNKRNPTAYFVSPEVYQEVLINKDNQEAYTYPIALDANGVLRIGTLPVYATNILTGGEALVGDFRRGVSLHQKKAIELKYSDSHGENFAKNITAVIVEGRVAVAVRKPDAFVKANVLLFS